VEETIQLAVVVTGNQIQGVIASAAGTAGAALIVAHVWQDGLESCARISAGTKQRALDMGSANPKKASHANAMTRGSQKHDW